MSDAGEAERGSTTALGAYFIIPLLACGLTIYYLVSTMDLIWEAKATGYFIGGILMSLCLAQMIRLGRLVWRGEGSLSLGNLTEDNLFNRQRLALLFLIFAFIVTLPWVGTALGLFAVLIACMWVMGVRSVRTLLIVAFTTALVVQLLLIEFVGSQLPQGVLGPLLSMLRGAV